MQAQIIYNGNNQPAYAVIPWQDYQRLAALDNDDEVMPFDVTNYIDNPYISGKNQSQQNTGTVSRIIGR